MRLAVRVRPGASRTRVGTLHDGRLVVAVSARAVDGAATRATLEAVAEALGVRPRHVTLVSGATNQDKVLDIADEALHPAAKARLAALLAPGLDSFVEG